MTEQRYRVVRRLDKGGMAEVFVGEQASVQGFKKKVAIKRVLPHLAENKNFIGMFLDEARLGARLTHANVVNVFDIGAADGTYFIVMEYIDGVDLKGLMEGLRGMGRDFPIKEAIFICIEALRGLSYAHELVDDNDEMIGLVHRDISPPNILLSKRGEVKVTDFGLAKATTQLEKTDPGVVKGKFSYLSPEAASGMDLDARADIFALGIVLWEMISGRRLFLGESDIETVKMVRDAKIPSLSRINPAVDSDLETVLLKALTKNPDDRYQSAAEFGDALASYLFRNQLKVTSYDLQSVIKEVIAQKVKKKDDQSIIDRLIQEELLRFTSIDDLSDPVLTGAEGGDRASNPEGAAPLDAGLFENPGDWFSNDAEVSQSVERRTSKGAQGWNEGGIESLPPSGSQDLSHLLESEPPSGGVASKGDSAKPAKTSSDSPSKATTFMLGIVLLLVLILAVGAIAVLTGQI